MAPLRAAPAVADDVFLENGNTFEGVIVVSETAEMVKIRLAYGDLSLPRSWISRIDRVESPLQIYLERRSALLGRDEVTADDCIELARWARPRDLPHGHKEALLEAAAIDPLHENLAPMLRVAGYVFDEEAGIWVSAAERRRAEAAAAAEESRRLAALERGRSQAEYRDPGRRTSEETLSRAVEALALAELERESRESQRDERRERTFYPVRVGASYGSVYPVAYFPGVVAAPVAGDPGVAASPPADPYESLRRRQPGSLLVARPGTGRVSSLSRVRRQPGALPLGNRR